MSEYKVGDRLKHGPYLDGFYVRHSQHCLGCDKEYLPLVQISNDIIIGVKAVSDSPEELSKNNAYKDVWEKYHSYFFPEDWLPDKRVPVEELIKKISVLLLSFSIANSISGPSYTGETTPPLLNYFEHDRNRLFWFLGLLCLDSDDNFWQYIGLAIKSADSAALNKSAADYIKAYKCSWQTDNVVALAEIYLNDLKRKTVLLASVAEEICSLRFIEDLKVFKNNADKHMEKVLAIEKS